MREGCRPNVPPGTRIAQRFLVEETLGSGGEGIVLRCHDEILGRDVAVKLIIGAAGPVDDVERLYALVNEARAQARLPHPNVVVVYDIGLLGPQGLRGMGESRTPFIVSELLDGTSLRAVLRSGPLAVPRAVDIAAQVADALAHAHAQGVVHRDIKPENLFSCVGGVVKVLDFGLAHALEAVRVERPAWGSAGYMPPEQAAGEVSPAVDVFALGVVLHEMLTGVRPGENQDRVDAPVALHDLIENCTASTPADRPSSQEVLHQLWRIRDAFGSATHHAHEERADAACPFPGLQRFREDDAKYFFGRTEETKECLRLIAHNTDKRWLAIEGASGAGKSSLVHAGIIPALRSGRLPPTSATWRFACLRPGRDPLASLERALATGLDATTRRKADLLDRAMKDGSILEAVEILLKPRERLLIVVDQLEEMFSADIAAETIERIDAIFAVLLTAPLPVFLVTTIRSDFVDGYRRLPRLRSILNLSAARYCLGPVSTEALADIVAGPSALAGLRLAPGITERIVADSGSEIGRLPLVAHVLRTLWENRESGEVTIEDYEALGGLAGALHSVADEIVLAAGPDGQERIRSILLALVRRAPGGQWTRRVTSRIEALAAAGGGAEAEAALQTLSAGPRLVMVSEGEGEPAVELVHETLLSGWSTLKRWVEEHRRELERRDDLDAIAIAWDAAGRPADGLARGAQLVYFELTESRSPVGAKFLEVSRLKSQVALKVRERQQRRRVALLTASLIVLASLSVWALVERHRAERSRAAALETADVLLNRIDSELNELPGTSETRARLLETTEQLLTNLGDEPHTRRALAQRRRRAGALASATGREKDIFVEFEHAVTLGRVLVREQPDDVAARIELSRALSRLRYESQYRNWIDRATQHGVESVEVVEPAFIRQPRSPAVVNAYATALRNLADAQLQRGDTNAAEQAIDRAQAALNHLPADQQWSQTVAELLWARARALRVRGMHQASISLARERLAMREAGAGVPGQGRTRLIAWGHLAVSDSLRAAGRCQPAAQEARTALSLAEAVDAAEPTFVHQHRDVRIASNLRLAWALVDCGIFGEARARAMIATTLLRSTPLEDPSWVRARVSAYAVLARVAFKEGDWLAADVLTRVTLDEMEKLFPRGEVGRDLLISACEIELTRARALLALGHAHRAAPALGRIKRLTASILGRNAGDVRAAELRREAAGLH